MYLKPMVPCRGLFAEIKNVMTDFAPYRRWIIFFLTSSLFVLSQFYRASIAVITPDLARDLSLDAGGLSMMSAAFFYAFAIAQLPIGIYLDRIGPRITMTVLSLIGIAGAFTFAWADSLTTLILGRALLGVGMACNLMGSMKLLTMWFTPLHFATLSALIVSIGTAGNAAATSPLVLCVEKIGWRWTFSGTAFVNLFLAILFFLVVRDCPQGRRKSPAGPRARPTDLFGILADLKQLFAKRDYWLISMSTFCRYGIYAAVQVLWAGPYLMNVHGLSALSTGNLILLLNMGFICAGPVWGILSDRVFKTRKWIVIAGQLLLSGILLALAFLPAGSSIFLLGLTFILFGMTGSSGGLMYTHIKEIMPLEKAGTAMTGINFFTMIGAASFLQGVGGYTQFFYSGDPFGSGAFQGIFVFCALCLIVVSGLYVLTRDNMGQSGES